MMEKIGKMAKIVGKFTSEQKWAGKLYSPREKLTQDGKKVKGKVVQKTQHEMSNKTQWNGIGGKFEGKLGDKKNVGAD